MNINRSAIYLFLSMVSYLILSLYQFTGLEDGDQFWGVHNFGIKTFLLVLILLTGIFVLTDYKGFRLKLFWFALGIFNIVFSILFLLIGYGISNFSLF